MVLRRMPRSVPFLIVLPVWTGTGKAVTVPPLFLAAKLNAASALSGYDEARLPQGPDEFTARDPGKPGHRRRNREARESRRRRALRKVS